MKNGGQILWYAIAICVMSRVAKLGQSRAAQPMGSQTLFVSFCDWRGNCATASQCSNARSGPIIALSHKCPANAGGHSSLEGL